MSAYKIKDGITAEQIAKSYLEDNGYQILASNVSFHKVGEIDIVAKIKDTLVIVEVKARADINFQYPTEAITYSKKKRIISATGAYLDKENPNYKDIRFDVIAIVGNEIKEHIEDAFYGKWLK